MIASAPTQRSDHRAKAGAPARQLRRRRAARARQTLAAPDSLATERELYRMRRISSVPHPKRMSPKASAPNKTKYSQVCFIDHGEVGNRQILPGSVARGEPAKPFKLC